MKIYTKSFQTNDDLQKKEFEVTKAQFDKRGKFGWFRFEVFKVNKSYQIVRFNPLETIINGIRDLFSKKKFTYFESKINKKLGKKVTIVRGLDKKDQKISSTAHKHLNRKTGDFPKNKIEKDKKGKEKVKKGDSKKTQAFEAKRKALKKDLLKAPKDFKASELDLDSILTEDALKKFDEKFQQIEIRNGQLINRNTKEPEPGAKIFESERVIMALDEFPDVVFKLSRMEFQTKISNEYNNRPNAFTYKQAEQICRDEGLNLLKIPKTKEIERNGIKIEVQEKADVIGNYDFQKGFLRQIQRDPVYKDYCHDLFKQMITLTVKLGFTDVKSDNFPIDKNGQIVLYDLDSNNSLSGLYSSGAQKGGGLFNVILLETFPDLEKHALDLAEKEVEQGRYSKEELDNLRNALTQIKDKKNERVQKYQNYDAYLKKQGITEPSQTLSIDKKKLASLFPEEHQNKCAAYFINLINSTLEERKSENIDMKRARKIKIRLRDKKIEDFLRETFPYKEFPEIKMAHHRYAKVEEVLEILKKENLIFSYKVKNRNFGHSSLTINL